MGKAQKLKVERRAIRRMSLEDRADVAESMGLETLLYCPHPWALAHSFAQKETGEMIRARCNRWDCLYCGPRKVDVWRQLVKEADPVLFLTLSKAGKTVEQAARALTTFMQALRRGSKGRGKGHVGARVAYPVEYFAVMERHSDFERNGFHWHLLLRGVEHIPYKEVIQPLWMSATHYDEETGEGAKIGKIEQVRSARAIGYVTKYLTKSLTASEVGTRQVERECVVTLRDEEGDVVGFEKQKVVDEVPSKAHRIRYSRNFFPERVAELRKRLFEGEECSCGEKKDGVCGDGKSLGKEEKRGSSWQLVKRERPGFVDVEEYKQRRYGELVSELEEVRKQDRGEYMRLKQLALAHISQEVVELVRASYVAQKRKVLLEALEDNKRISRRVISMWDYQRKQRREERYEQEKVLSSA